MADSWSESEVAAIVNDYFEMLSCEMAGQPYNKSQHRRKLSSKLLNRSNGSIERKHQNISAILIELGMPYISGYKPLKNYQRYLLPDAILDYLAKFPKIHTQITQDIETVPAVPSIDDILSILVDPPEKNENSYPKIADSSQQYSRYSCDYLKREASNIRLGLVGEKFAINFERARLIAAGKENLADKIEHVSIAQGDHLGFDILSFELNGSDRFIECKTTKYGINTPFYISANELRFSEINSCNYYLYRIFEFRESPRIFALHGNIRNDVQLTPTNFSARI